MERLELLPKAYTSSLQQRMDILPFQKTNGEPCPWKPNEDRPQIQLARTSLHNPRPKETRTPLFACGLKSALKEDNHAVSFQLQCCS